MTISHKGVTQFFDKEAYFITMEDYEREEHIYHQLQTI